MKQVAYGLGLLLLLSSMSAYGIESMESSKGETTQSLTTSPSLGISDRRLGRFLNCENRLGSILCNKIDNALNLLDYECRGNHCYELFDRQQMELDGLTYAINYFLEGNTEVSLELYKKAHKLSKEICISRVTGEANAVTRLIISMNSSLLALKKLQNQLRKPSGDLSEYKVYSCRMIVD